jgi:DNA invertase Pin-like site-specific DNA recombinase
MKIGYARVSTTDQDTTIQSEKLNDAKCDRVFVEKKSGGSTQGREQLNIALSFLRDGDVLVVTRLDRLARSLSDLLAIVQRIEAVGASFVCLEQDINTGSATGRLQLHMLAAFAEFERGMIRERQAEGIAKAKAEGRYHGRPATIDTAEVQTRRDAGEKPTHIARDMKISRASVYRVLEVLRGKTTDA